MKNQRNIVQKSIVMFALLGLFFATNYHSFGQFQKSKEQTEKKDQEKQFVLQSVTFEATHSVISYHFLNEATIIFSFFKSELLHEFISPNILFPDFINRCLKILFTRIIPTKAP